MGNFHFVIQLLSLSRKPESSEMNMVELCKPSTRAEWDLISNYVGTQCFKRKHEDNMFSNTPSFSPNQQSAPMRTGEMRMAYSSPGQNVQKIQVQTLVNKKQTAKHLNPQPPGTTDSRGVVK